MLRFCRLQILSAFAALQAADDARATVLTITDAGEVYVSAPVPASKHPPAPRPRSPQQGIAEAINDAGNAQAVARELITAIAWVESRFQPNAVSPAGATGVMQLMPGTARDLGVNPREPRANIAGGAAYLRQLLDRFDGDLVRAVAAYNAGPGAVERYGGVPPYAETQRYVAAVLAQLAAHTHARSQTGVRRP